MSSTPAKARVGDPVTHSSALWGLLEGALLGAALGAILVASGGTAAPLLIAGAAATGASIGGAVGKLWGATQVVPCGTILTGSPNVYVNGKPAAFVGSLVSCSQHPGPQTIVEGSGSVEINGRRAARVGDRCSCGCVIAPAGSPDVSVGGPAVMPAGAAAAEVPWYADAGLFVLGMAGGGALLKVGGLGAGAIAAKLGGSLLGGELGGRGGRALGGEFFGEGSTGQTVLGVAGSLVGGLGGDFAGGRAAGGGLIRPAETRYTGARTIDVRRIDAWDRAEAGYDGIRGQTEDVGAVAHNTGWPEYRVQRVKNHVFFRDHQLDDGVRRFDADPEMHNAWVRLTEGEHTPEDVRLLDHEYFESRFESLFRTDYRTAHTATVRSGRTWP